MEKQMKYFYMDEPDSPVFMSPVDLTNIINLLPDTILFLPQRDFPENEVKVVAMDLCEIGD